jgi:hypothetical protein
MKISATFNSSIEEYGGKTEYQITEINTNISGFLPSISTVCNFSNFKLQTSNFKHQTTSNFKAAGPDTAEGSSKGTCRLECHKIVSLDPGSGRLKSMNIFDLEVSTFHVSTSLLHYTVPWLTKVDCRRNLYSRSYVQRFVISFQSVLNKELEDCSFVQNRS